MDKMTEKILTKDSLADTEKALGDKHWSQFNRFENLFALSRAATDNEIKQNHLKIIGDTNSDMKWDEFKELLENKGFVNALTYDFKYEDRTEQAILYYNPQNGLILWATSFGNKDHINGGELYGQIKSKGEEHDHTIWRWLSTGGMVDKERHIYETRQDIREGLFSKLDTLESAGEWMPVWVGQGRFLWFADYVESKQAGFDYEIATAEKIKKCPEQFRKILCK